MGYEEALEKAGAEIHWFQEFGSYQGNWWAKITYNGVTGWIEGSYGSCSVCDAFQAEFGCDNGHCENHRWEYDENIINQCPECKKEAIKYDERLSEFGKSYLDNIMTQDEAIARASENIEWDMEAEDMVKYIKEN